MKILMKITIYLLFTTLLSLNIAFGQNTDLLQDRTKSLLLEQNPFTAVPPDLIKRSDNFFEHLIKKQISTGYKELLQKSPIARKENEIENLIKQTMNAFELYGELKNYEPVNAEFVSPSYLRLRYLGLHSRYPMRWVFTFYNSPDLGWIITNIKFDDLSEYYFTDQ